MVGMVTDEQVAGAVSIYIARRTGWLTEFAEPPSVFTWAFLSGTGADGIEEPLLAKLLFQYRAVLLGHLAEGKA